MLARLVYLHHCPVSFGEKNQPKPAALLGGYRGRAVLVETAGKQGELKGRVVHRGGCKAV